jgi:uncharacterized membrane protein YeaQ/YmgE (transglycosylase-associated protein family)
VFLIGPFPNSPNPVILRLLTSSRENAMAALVVWLIVGALAGWIAGVVVKGGGFGLIGNIVVGILGSIVAGYLFPVLGIHLGAGLIGSVLHAAIGAIILLFVLSLIRRA